jgi:hypothetical protein
MAFCYLFWITTLAWIVRYIIGAKVKGGLFVLMGITCNASVTLLNGGVMPSVGISPTFQPASTIWNVSGKGRWLLLADHAALYRFSNWGHVSNRRFADVSDRCSTFCA